MDEAGLWANRVRTMDLRLFRRAEKGIVFNMILDEYHKRQLSLLISYVEDWNSKAAVSQGKSGGSGGGRGLRVILVQLGMVDIVLLCY